MRRSRKLLLDSKRSLDRDRAMRTAVFVLLTAVLLYFVFFANAPCPSLRRGTFQSIAVKTEVTRLPDAEPALYAQYHTTLSFGFGQYTQQESDFFTTGYYTCRSGKVIAHSSSGKSISVDYDPASGTLVWDGQRYQQNRAQP